MFRLVSLLLICALASIRLAAQSEDTLLYAFDSLYNARKTAEYIPVGEAWRDLVLKQGIKDTSVFVSRLIKIADGLRFLNQGPKALETLLPGFGMTDNDAENYPDLIKMNGAILAQMGAYLQADSCYDAAQKAYRLQKLDNSVRYNSLLRGMADSKLRQGYVAAANEAYEAALNHRTENNLPEDISLGTIFSGLASVNEAMGNFSKAAFWISKCVESYSKFLSPTHPAVLSNQSIYVNLLIQNGDLGQAEPLALKILEAYESNGYLETPYYGGALESMAAILGGLGQDQEALSLLKKAGAIFEQSYGADHQVTLHNKLNQAQICFGMGAVIEAKTLGIEVKNALMASADIPLLDLAETLSFLAGCTDDIQEAIFLCETATKECQTASGSMDCGNLNRIPLKLAFNYLKAGNYDKCRETLGMMEAGVKNLDVNSDGFLRWLHLSTLLAFLKGNQTEALEILHRFSAIRIDMACSELFVMNEASRLDMIRFLNQHAALMLTLAERAVNDPENYAMECLNFQLFYRAMSLTATEKVIANIKNDPELGAVFDDWRGTREALAWSYSQPAEVLESRHIKIADLEHRSDVLEKELISKSAGFAAGAMRQLTDWASIKNQLQKGEVAMQIARYKNHLFAESDTINYAVFIISPDYDKPKLVFFKDGADLDKLLIEKFLVECALPGSKGQTRFLYDAFWKKLEPYLQGTSRIYVAADGAFYKINLGAIQLPAGGYVADRFDLCPVFSLKDIHQNTPAQRQGNPTLSVSAFLTGNPAFLQKPEVPGTVATLRGAAETPDSSILAQSFEASLRQYDETRGLTLSPLPGSEKEVIDIAKLLRQNGWQTTVVTGKEATEDTIKSVRNPAILHLATHGYFLSNVRSGTAGLSRSVLERNPMLRSMVFFAGAQNTLDKAPIGNEDGILTAYEAQNLQLEGTELVVLSACQTAQGKIQNGEGVYGLQRALRIAGAKSVLMSLWDIDDKVGREFMTSFYTHWLKGSTKAEAFRKAQLEVKKKHPQPFYWAGFLLLE